MRGIFLKQWNQYLLIREVGKGGTAHVYLGADKESGKKYAIKRYESSMDFEQARKEFQMVKELCHPGIPLVHDIIKERNGGSVVMEYVPGSTLKERILSQGRISEKQAAAWGVELCDIIAFLHRQSRVILYRDLKPANVMITPSSHVKLIDFGAALRCDRYGNATSEAVGTRGYAAPEQFRSESILRTAVDVYGFGATMVHMLTGRKPEQKGGDCLAAVRDCPVSAKMKAILSKCLQPEPQERYRFFEEIKRDLEYPGVPQRNCGRFRITRSEIGTAKLSER